MGQAEDGTPCRLTHTVPIQALIDTGATATAIHHDIAAMLGLPKIDMQKVGTAHGEVDVPVVVAAVLFPPTEAGHEPIVHHLRVTAMNLGREAMLFGMDLMKYGVLEVNRVDETWGWSAPR